MDSFEIRRYKTIQAGCAFLYWSYPGGVCHRQLVEPVWYCIFHADLHFLVLKPLELEIGGNIS